MKNILSQRLKGIGQPKNTEEIICFLTNHMKKEQETKAYAQLARLRELDRVSNLSQLELELREAGLGHEKWDIDRLPCKLQDFAF